MDRNHLKNKLRGNSDVPAAKAPAKTKTPPAKKPASKPAAKAPEPPAALPITPEIPE